MSNKSDLVNKRHLEKMEETRYKRAFCPFPINILHSRNCKKCLNCRFFNRCKLEKSYSCSNYKGWQDE